MGVQVHSKDELQIDLPTRVVGSQSDTTWRINIEQVDKNYRLRSSALMWHRLLLERREFSTCQQSSEVPPHSSSSERIALHRPEISVTFQSLVIQYGCLYIVPLDASSSGSIDTEATQHIGWGSKRAEEQLRDVRFVQSEVFWRQADLLSM